MNHSRLFLFSARKALLLVHLLYLISSVFIADFNGTTDFFQEISHEDAGNNNGSAFSDLLDDSSEDFSDTKVLAEKRVEILWDIHCVKSGSMLSSSYRKGSGFIDQLFSPPDWI